MYAVANQVWWRISQSLRALSACSIAIKTACFAAVVAGGQVSHLMLKRFAWPWGLCDAQHKLAPSSLRGRYRPAVRRRDNSVVVRLADNIFDQPVLEAGFANIANAPLLSYLAG